MPLWAWLVGALLVIGLIVMAARTVRVQNELGEIQAKLERAENEAEQAATRAAEFSNRVNDLDAELEAAKTQRENIQAKLDQANSENAELKRKLSSDLEAAKTQREDIQTKLDQANSEIAQLKSKLGSAQSELQEKQARTEAVQNELASTRRASDEAKADAAKEKEQSNAIQGKIDQANAEIDRLNTELEQTKAALPSTVIAAPVEQPTEAETKTIHREITPDQITWGPMPPGLPEGAQSVVLAGDPSKDGPFVIRVNAPAGYTVPPHWHSKDEDVTLISGRAGMAMGEILNKEAGKALSAGSFIHMPAGTTHYAWSEEDSVLQISGIGPFDITYVNPEDDPRKQP
jgi:predicted  nucleic acid-binding Zn-ribbon protein/quercetin dioxygenase-like cupin family protein